MLSWADIQTQIERYAENRLEAARLIREAKARSLKLLKGELSVNWEMWKERAAQESDVLIPDFDESPATVYPVETDPSPAVLIATDGSQIIPSRHEVAPIALITVSRIRIDYANYRDTPLMDCLATVLQPDDFEQSPLDREDRAPSFAEQVGDRRTLEEMKILFDLADESKTRQTPDGSVPILALIDGSPILWQLAGRFERDYEKRIVDDFVSRLRSFESIGVPVAGYISNSGSREVTKLIRLAGRETQTSSQEHECEPILTDTVLFSSLLETAQRSTLFHSRSKILRLYGDQSISCFYLHVGDELARVEVPRWVANDRSLVDAVAAQCLRQARLGQGYPIVLSEAHEHAVVRGPDRETFYALIERSLLDKGLQPRLSAKQLRKRVSIL